MLTFAMTTYKDVELARKSIKALKEFYPKASIVLCNDEIEHLKVPEKCGAWTERWMKKSMETEADIIVKVDPDTRAFNSLWGHDRMPDADVFGVVAPNWVYAALGATGVLYGACIGFRRTAVKAILDSGFLHDPKYKTFAYEGQSIQDPIVTDVVKRLGLSIGYWKNLHIRTRFDGLGTFDRNKVTFAHPVGMTSD